MTNLKKWVQVGQGEFMKWNDKGQEIEGTWRGQKDGQYGPLGLVDTSHGRVSFPLHTALLDKVERIKDGAEVKIIYLGKQPTRDGKKEYKAFEVYVANVDDIADPAAKPDDTDIPF